jgi:hypothetical protein
MADQTRIDWCDASLSAQTSKGHNQTIQDQLRGLFAMLMQPFNQVGVTLRAITLSAGWYGVARGCLSAFRDRDNMIVARRWIGTIGALAAEVLSQYFQTIGGDWFYVPLATVTTPPFRKRGLLRQRMRLVPLR